MSENENEIDGDLDRYPSQPVDFWKAKQRELVTSVVDYNLSTLVSLVDEGLIDVSPDYQRRYRWDPSRRSRLIESFLMNVPVPPLFLNEDDLGTYSVIDGKQRLSSIIAFFKGEFCLTGLEVFADLNGQKFLDLPVALQTVLRTRPTLRATIILAQSDSNVKYEVFTRLNTGGVTLNAQEIRNSVYPGPLNKLLIRLASHETFRKLLKIENLETSQIYAEMRDVEFVLRFFAFREVWQSPVGGMRQTMDSYMDKNQRMGQEDLEKLDKTFNDAIAAVWAAFGEFAFMRWQPERGQWRNQIIASIFDAQMFACLSYDAQKLLDKRDDIVHNMKLLFADREFRSAIDAATNTASLFTKRIKKVQAMLRDVVGEG